MRYKYSDDEISAAVATSKSIRQTMLTLGMRLAGGSHSHLTKRIKTLELDTSHFIGQKGGLTTGKRKHWTEILILRTEGSRQHGRMLTRALVEIGIQYECSICSIFSWNGLVIVLEVDHINKNWLDDRAENLRFLCPNCHSQVTKGVYPNWQRNVA